jgi:DNA-binding transcriptional ArsR family regulator
MHRTISNFEMPQSEVVEKAAEQLRILGDPTRLKLLWALAQGETSVACLAEIAGTTPTAASQHLAKLRMSGLVRVRRQGTFMLYTLEDEGITDLLRHVLEQQDEPGKLRALTTSRGR